MPHYMLVVSYDGEEHITVDGHSEVVPAGGAYLVQPGSLVDYFGSKTGNRPAFAHFDLVFSEHRGEYKNTPDFATTLDERAHLLQPTTEELFNVALPIRVPQLLERMLARQVDTIVEEWSHGGELGKLRANSLLLTLIIDWVRSQASAGETVQAPLGIEERLRRAEALARNSLEKGFSSEDFAHHAGFSRTHFSRIYRAHRGQSPGEALREMRLSEAFRLLKETRLNVVEIARLVGFPGASALARAFRQKHGCSPSDLRAGREG
ncbi:MAG: AraC family transcriptional regulator [Polyangiaceae bacterium]|nr:AraC family transcriptional regulator [Polyangiaceae bacterium]